MSAGGAATAVVFGYGDMGVRGTRILLEQGVTVELVVTHQDDPNENRWYGSLAEFAAGHSLPCVTPAKIDEGLVARVAALAPDFIFSFYYRNMIPMPLLSNARRGALNMHGSMLPRFRGRAPVNWAIVRGASETGATLHYMVEKADAGDIVDQAAVPIGENDTAVEVFYKVADAAELILRRSLPLLIAGTAPRRVQNLAEGEYCGRRRPEDGRIDWSRPAREIHNLVRAVAPPFPGAFGFVDGQRWLVSRTRVLPRKAAASDDALKLRAEDDGVVVTCADGERLQVLEASDGRGSIDLAALSQSLAGAALPVS
ncbi:MAG TPA: formyltransferase [Acetobacteraceae bacterium]|jgi:methionyl-tRNA formyltransferase|nr:formyltransferase [Acetobacteraceae bacterium]